MSLYLSRIVQSNPAISNSVNSKSPLFRTKIEFPWIYPSPLRFPGYFETPLFRTFFHFPWDFEIAGFDCIQPPLKNGTPFFGYESLSNGYNVLNEFMFQSHMRFSRMQWLPTRFYGSLSENNKRKNSPLAAQLKIAFRRFLSL